MNKKAISIFLISNMYPSKELPRYGIFVKNFEEQLKVQDVKFPLKSVLKGTPHANLLIKAFKYIRFYLSIIFKGLLFFKSYNLVYVHYPLHTALPVLPISLFKKTVINFHGSDLLSDTPFKKTMGLFRKILAQKASAIIAPSEYYKREISILLQVPADKIIIYPSGGIDLSKFQSLSNNGRQLLRKELNLPQNGFIAGFVSTFIEKKGWRIFLDGLRYARTNGCQIYGLMVGDGPDRNKIQAYLSNSGLNDSLTVETSVNQEKLVKYYNTMDIFLFPTMRYDESLGLVGLEAMACGVPVIASDYAGPKDYISQGENGFFFRKADAWQLSEVLTHYYQLDNEERASLSKGALRTVQLYDANQVNNMLKQQLLKLL